MVVTTNITDVTPSAFGAHINSRSCETEIARQYIKKTGIDVLLGAGIVINVSPCDLSAQDINALIVAAQNAYGYAYVTTKAGMQAADIFW